MHSKLISLSRVTFWFDTVYNIVTLYKKKSCMNMNYNYPTTIYLEVSSPKMYKFLVEKYIFTFFANELFKVKMKNCKSYQKYIIFGSKYF